MRKFLSLMFALIMMLVITVPALAYDYLEEPEYEPVMEPAEELVVELVAEPAEEPVDEPVEAPQGQIVTWVDGFGFHCNTFGGNGRTDIIVNGITLGGQNVNHHGIGSAQNPVDIQNIIGTTLWNLLRDDIVCATCGSTAWITFSNNSGVPNGRNIQVHHPAKPEPPPTPTLEYIYKTVNGVNIADWAAANGINMADLVGSMSFVAYQNGVQVSVGVLQLNGRIVFTPPLAAGTYTIVETVTGTSKEIFGDGATQVIIVNTDGGLVEVSTTNRYVSDATQGVLVSAQAGVHGIWNLPNVWNTALADQPNFQRLVEMGAQWIWGTENTFIYGIEGSVWGTEITVTVDQTMTIPIYFAADNVAAIYVNNNLAAYTTVAFMGDHRPDLVTTLPDFVHGNPTAAATFVFGSLDYYTFHGGWDEGWQHSYRAMITLTAGENTITILAANSRSTGEYVDYVFVPGNTGRRNDTYNSTNNPCGVIFGFEITSTTFNNRIGNWQDSEYLYGSFAALMGY